MLRRLYRDQGGLTLIELLAVIVILAIIAAIAIPSIGGIINKTKKEAHNANAQMIIDGARFKVTAEGFTKTGTDSSGNDIQEMNLQDIVNAGYLDKPPKDPEASGNTSYDTTRTKVTVTQDRSTGKLSYRIALYGSGKPNAYLDKTEEELQNRNSSSPSPSVAPSPSGP